MPHAIAPRIEAVPTGTAGLVGEAGQGPVDRAVPVTNVGEFQQTFGGAGGELFLGVVQFFANEGRRAWVVRVAGRSARAIERGLAALDAADDVDLVCLPGLSGGRALAAGAAYARSRGISSSAIRPAPGRRPSRRDERSTPRTPATPPCTSRV